MSDLLNIADEVKSRIQIADLIGASVTLTRKGPRFVGLCPFHAENSPSFTVEPAKRFFHCFGCGAHGDAIDWVKMTQDMSFADAVRDLAKQCGVSRDTAETAEDRATRQSAWLAAKRETERQAAERQAAAEARRRSGAAEIWRLSRRDARLGLYLEGRGIDLAAIARGWPDAAPDGIPFSLQFLIDCPDFEERREDPAMVACMVDHDRRFMGVHRTFLSRDLTAKRSFSAKKMLGRAWGSVVRLAPPAPRLFLCEGIETGLSIMAALSAAGEARSTSVFAALSIGNMAGGGIGAIPDLQQPAMILPPGIAELVICEDADNKDPRSADAQYARAASRFGHRAKMRVRRARPQPGMDFNDMARLSSQVEQPLGCFGGA